MAAFGVEAQLVIHPILRNRQERVYKMGDGGRVIGYYALKKRFYECRTY